MPTRHLCISVTFLQPTCHARLGKEDAAPNEWPPSPLRLFQAIVAGAAARWAGDGATGDGDATAASLSAPAPVAALRWLERLCEVFPPIILAPRAVVGSPVPHYVPNNSADLVAAKWSRGDTLATFDDRTRKLFRPMHMRGGTTVHYLWALDEAHAREAEQHIRTLTAAARCIVALGWGIDAAIGDARIVDDPRVDSLAVELEQHLVRWTPRPAPTSGTILRLPCHGTLAALIDRHAAFLRRLEGGVFRPTPHLRVFRQAAYACGVVPATRPLAAFALRWIIDPTIAELDTNAGRAERRKEGKFRAFRIEHAARVAAMLRHTACEVAQQDPSHEFPGGSEMYVAGHTRRVPALTRADTPPRFSYLPLPSITGPYPDGMIRRVMIAEPFGADGSHTEWAARALHGRRLVGTLARDGPPEPLAVLEGIGDWSGDQVIPAFVMGGSREGSREWITTTPIVLPGYDGLDVRKAAKLMSRACDQAGLPPGSVESFEFTGPPRWSGGGRPFVPRYLRGLPMRHARITFREPVRGPAALGAGRHCGLGVLSVRSDPSS